MQRTWGSVYSALLSIWRSYCNCFERQTRRQEIWEAQLYLYEWCHRVQCNTSRSGLHIGIRVTFLHFKSYFQEKEAINWLEKSSRVCRSHKQWCATFVGRNSVHTPLMSTNDSVLKDRKWLNRKKKRKPSNSRWENLHTSLVGDESYLTCRLWTDNKVWV